MGTQSNPGVYSARPTVYVDGQEADALGDGLQSLMVEETSAGLYHCEATFANWGPVSGTTGYLYFDRQTLDFGKPLRIECGGGVAAGQIFDGRITSMEGRYMRERPPELLVLAEDRLQDLRMTRRTRAFEQISDSYLFQQIASAQGLTPDIDVTGPTYPVLAQVNQSDLAFMRDRARAIDAEVWVTSTTLHAQARSRRNAGAVVLTLGKGLYECTVNADLAEQVSGFAVSGWDVSAKQAIQYRATDSVLAGELPSSDTGGSSVLGTAIGTRDQQVVHLAPFSSTEAQALAEARYRRAARRFVVAHGMAEGDSRVIVGAQLTLAGLGAMFDGQYYVTRTRHVFDSDRGYRTQFAAERPGISS
jgi:hypothetical protein